MLEVRRDDFDESLEDIMASINGILSKTGKGYETKEDDNMLVYIEFSLEDKSKDISFEVNKYEIYSNEYKNIFKEEKIEDTFKFFILCGGYSLYQIIFDKNDNDATGTMSNQNMTYDQQVALTVNAYQKVGYHFSKWTTNDDGTGTLTFSLGNNTENSTAN